MREANGTGGFVDVLPPCPAREHIFANVFVAEFDFGVLVDFRRDIDGGETGLPFAFRIERTDAHQAVHTGFAFEVAISHGTADGDRSMLDAGDSVILTVEQLGFVSVFLAQSRYMRSIISAQSLASVPPSRALMDRMAALAS